MRRIKSALSRAGYLLIAMIVSACVQGVRLVPSSAKPEEMKGTYTLLLYGCQYPADVKDVAFFVSDDSKYPLDIIDIDSSYKVKTGLTASQAMDAASKFVRCSSYSLWQTQLQQIPDENGGVIGYELRPLYLPYQLGVVDAMDISYFLKNGKVVTYIKLDPYVQRNFEASGGDLGSSGSQ